MTPQTYNRLTATVATGVFLLVSVLLAGLSGRRSSDSLLQRPSTFFTDPSGARALFLVMQQLLPQAAQWRRPLSFLPPPEISDAPSTLIVAEPSRPLSGDDAEHLERWLQAGGQLILLSTNGWPLQQRAISSSTEQPPAEVQPETFLARYAPSLRWTSAGRMNTARATGPSVPPGEVTLGWRRSFADTSGAKLAAAASNARIAVEIPVGQGRILALADPTMASNAALRRSDNAVWLVHVAAAWGNGRILFDEYHHGFAQKRGTAELTQAFLVTPWGWCVLQIAAAGVLYIFAYRRRFGRIREPPIPVRASPLELVDARAGVLQAAAAQGVAADLIVQHLCQELTKARHKSVDNARLSDDLSSLAKDGKPPAAALQTLYAKVKSGQRLSDREFVELGRSAGETLREFRR